MITQFKLFESDSPLDKYSPEHNREYYKIWDKIKNKLHSYLLQTDKFSNLRSSFKLNVNKYRDFVGPPGRDWYQIEFKTWGHNDGDDAVTPKIIKEATNELKDLLIKETDDMFDVQIEKSNISLDNMKYGGYKIYVGEITFKLTAKDWILDTDKYNI